MKRVLKIEHDDGSGPPGMIEILELIRPYADGLNWTLFDLWEVVPKESNPLDFDSLDPAVHRGPTGSLMRFEDVLAFEAQIEQLIDGVFVGCSDPQGLPLRSDPDETVIDRADILFAAVGGTAWLVSAPQKILDRFELLFDHVAVLEPEGIQLSRHGRES